MKKLLFIALSVFALFGCEDEPKQVQHVPQPQPPIVFEFDDSYSMLDVENNYVSCLIINGIDQDDYCEEQCADIFDYDSCDSVEDKYERIYGIGTDRPDNVFITSYQEKNKIKSEGTWKKYGTQSCSTMPMTSSVEKGKKFNQTKKCVSKYYRTVKYTNGSSTTQYKTETVSSVSIPAIGTKVVKTTPVKATNTSTGANNVTTSQTANKYSSNLLASDKLKTTTEKTTNASTGANNVTTSQTANKYSSNLLASDKLKTTTEKNKTEPVKTEAAQVEETTISETEAVVAGGAAVAATKYSSNLLASEKLKKKAPVTVTSTGQWKNSGSAYSCSSWSPRTSSKKKGERFTQYANCKQKQTQLVKYSDGSTKTNTKVSTVRKEKPAIGTKASNSSSSSSSKSYSSSKKSKQQKKYK